ncbi:hypothetical protein BX600DRAFT_90141 [Xylariales sp. PMI_506]|nr:hypothetical protein BX600DRAFT_90141 [Xylariales sp. PMI_506]
MRLRGIYKSWSPPSPDGRAHQVYRLAGSCPTDARCCPRARGPKEAGCLQSLMVAFWLPHGCLALQCLVDGGVWLIPPIASTAIHSLTVRGRDDKPLNLDSTIFELSNPSLLLTVVLACLPPVAKLGGGRAYFRREGSFFSSGTPTFQSKGLVLISRGGQKIMSPLGLWHNAPQVNTRCLPWRTS